MVHRIGGLHIAELGIESDTQQLHHYQKLQSVELNGDLLSSEVCRLCKYIRLVRRTLSQ